MDWSAADYRRFEDERTRPARDLLAQVPTPQVAAAVDIGCGPGNSTELLRARYPGARLLGIDSAPDMIAAARKRLPDVRFEAGGHRGLGRSGGRYDLIFANAVLQWLPGHGALMPSLLARLAPGGASQCRCPTTSTSRRTSLMRETAAGGPWAGKLGGAAAAREARHDADWYWRLLRDDAAKVDVWRTVYHHPLAGGARGVVDWFRATGLRPFLAPLTPTSGAASSRATRRR